MIRMRGNDGAAAAENNVGLGNGGRIGICGHDQACVERLFLSFRQLPIRSR